MEVTKSIDRKRRDEKCTVRQVAGASHVRSEGVRARALMRSRSDLSLDVVGRIPHGDLERVANAGAKQRLQRAVDAAIDASLDMVCVLCVALRELVDELLDLAELRQHQLRPERLVAVAHGAEVAHGNGRLREDFHLGVQGGVSFGAGTGNGLVPREDLDDSKSNCRGKVRVGRARAAQ